MIFPIFFFFTPFFITIIIVAFYDFCGQLCSSKIKGETKLFVRAAVTGKDCSHVL